MTEEQLTALELWITAIIHDLDRASDVHEALTRLNAREDVLRAFGLRDKPSGN